MSGVSLYELQEFYKLAELISRWKNTLFMTLPIMDEPWRKFVAETAYRRVTDECVIQELTWTIGKDWTYLRNVEWPLVSWLVRKYLNNELTDLSKPVEEAVAKLSKLVSEANILGDGEAPKDEILTEEELDDLAREIHGPEPPAPWVEPEDAPDDVKDLFAEIDTLWALVVEDSFEDRDHSFYDVFEGRREQHTPKNQEDQEENSYSVNLCGIM
uniref:DDE-1 domain-containing protein n=1 Tax=Steinernema glaseri TaxID=37863 RepID=A0A1I7YWB2_9BILA